MDRRSGKFVGDRVPFGKSILRICREALVNAAATAPRKAVDVEFRHAMPIGEDPLDYVSEPLMVLDRGGNIVAANLAARTLIASLEIDPNSANSVERVLAKVRVTNGGGKPPWIPTSETGGLEAVVASPEPLTGGPLFELSTTPRGSAKGGKAGWIVRLVNVTPLVAALREKRSVTDQRDQLLKLLSHDMRTPLAAILTTLRHPDLGAMPDNLRQIIEKAAYRALHMVDHNARLIRAQFSNYTFAALDFRHVVEEVIDGVWSLSKSSGVKLVLDLPDDELLILADRGSLTEALTDLCRQLLKTSHAGRTLRFEVSAASLRGSPAVKLCIRELHDKVAERLQSRASGGPPYPSRSKIDPHDDANGMVFLKTVVSRHSGTMTLNSQLGVHRTVSITIPSTEV